jgi:hypothetical protein
MHYGYIVNGYIVNGYIEYYEVAIGTRFDFRIARSRVSRCENERRHSAGIDDRRLSAGNQKNNNLSYSHAKTQKCERKLEF